MRFRCLTYQEFEVLETDFSDFLYDHGFNHFEWNVLQDQNSREAQNLLKTYSDQTFEKVMKEIDFLQLRKPNLIRTIQFKAVEYVCIDVRQTSELQFDFTKLENVHFIPNNFFTPIRIRKSTHTYEKPRENEIFERIESGYYQVSSEAYFKMDQIRVKQEN